MECLVSDVEGLVTRADPPLDLEAIFVAHRSMLVRLAVMLVDDLATAEDVVQDAFAGLVKNQARLRSADKVEGYLRVGVVNNAHGVLRRRGTARRFRHSIASEQTAPGADLDALLAEEYREVFAAVRSLPPRQREVIVLRYWTGLSEAQIATTLGISAGGVKSQASRAMRKIQTTLGAS